MKTGLRLAFTGLLFSLLLSGSAYAQVTYTEDFESDDHGWTETEVEEGVYEFADTDESPCDGDGSLRGNPYNYFDFFIVNASTVSPNLGAPDGSQQVLSFNYKIVDYFSAGGEPETAAIDWGFITIEYGTSPTGPWTPIETITPANHESSLDCASRSMSFTPAAGAALYLRIYGEANADQDFYLYVDDISVTPSEACTGTPADSAAVADDTDVCLTQEVTVSLSIPYLETGIEFQWQVSQDGVTYEDVAEDGDGPTYTTTQTITTWYRAIITCEASGLSATSEPVEVVSNGELCFCEIDFTTSVEPITLVQFAGIDNTTNAEPDATAASEDFTDNEDAQGLIMQGETYPITLAGNTVSSDEAQYESFFTVYIDFNQNGILDDEGEVFEIGSVTGSDGEDDIVAEGDIAIPDDALLGPTRMRVVKMYDEFVEGPCGNYNFGQAEDYTVIVDAAASTGGFSQGSFSYYPNPVRDVLNLSYTKDISGVEVYNIVGQQVMVKTVNDTQSQIDMSGLPAGTYMVKVTANGTSKTVKVIKQ